jgi:hypothetical protein
VKQRGYCRFTRMKWPNGLQELGAKALDFKSLELNASGILRESILNNALRCRPDNGKKLR